MNEKQDLRIKKSLQRIEDSFFSCIEEKPFSKVTINDITRRAMINKTTFYTHYEDKYDLREKIVTKTVGIFEKNINISFVYMEPENVHEYADNLIEPLMFIYNNRQKYSLLWHKNMEYDVLLKMHSAFENTMRHHLLSHKNPPSDGLLSPERELFVRLFAGNCMCTIRWWLDVCPEVNVNDVATIITDCLAHGEISAFKL